MIDVTSIVSDTNNRSALKKYEHTAFKRLDKGSPVVPPNIDSCEGGKDNTIQN